MGAFCIENAPTLISVDFYSVATRPTLVAIDSHRVIGLQLGLVE
jgi:hypothetical protein